MIGKALLPFPFKIKNYTKEITNWNIVQGSPVVNGSTITLPNAACAVESVDTFEFGTTGFIQLQFVTANVGNRNASSPTKSTGVNVSLFPNGTTNYNGFFYVNYVKDGSPEPDTIILNGASVYNTIKAYNGYSYIVELSQTKASFISQNVTRYTSNGTFNEPFRIRLSNAGIGSQWVISDIKIKTF